MSSWNIDPSGVEALLRNVQSEQESLNGALEQGDFQAIFTALASAGDFRGDVSTALNGLLDDQKRNLDSITSRVAAGANGVGFAVRACNQGNEEMAATVQTEMMHSATTGDFTFFEKMTQEGVQ